MHNFADTGETVGCEPVCTLNFDNLVIDGVLKIVPTLVSLDNNGFMDGTAVGGAEKDHEQV